MNAYARVKDLLEREKRARERRMRLDAITYLLNEKFALKQRFGASGELLKAISKEILALDRAWRKVTEKNLHLRGEDYDGGKFAPKKAIEQLAQIELGYESGYHENIKKLRTL